MDIVFKLLDLFESHRKWNVQSKIKLKIGEFKENK